MPATQWSKLSRMQLGRYAEYYSKMEFTSYGFEVYTSEVDDHGVDFVVRSVNGDTFYEVQVKAVRNYQYTFITKEKMAKSPSIVLPDNRIVCFLRFEDGFLPEVYTIPATAWVTPNTVLKSNDYIGLKSKPEWGISISNKNIHLLQEYRIENKINSFVT